MGKNLLGHSVGHHTALRHNHQSVSLCGLVTNDDLNVLGSDLKTPIKGLYAVGNCLGQRFGNAYSTPAAGSSIGMALTHGYVAGKIAAGGTVK